MSCVRASAEGMLRVHSSAALLGGPLRTGSVPSAVTGVSTGHRPGVGARQSIQRGGGVAGARQSIQMNAMRKGP